MRITFFLPMIIFLIVPTSFSLAANADHTVPLAENSGGSMDVGGGRGIACFATKEQATQVKALTGSLTNEMVDQIESFIPFDLYFSSLARGIPPVAPDLITLNFEGEEFTQIVSRQIERVKMIIPSFGLQMDSIWNKFQRNEIVWSRDGLISIEDDNIIESIPNECALVTLALQYKLDNVDYLQIDPRLFYLPKMNEMGRASLIMHEIIYNIGRNHGATSSRGTRIVMSKILRKEHTLHLADIIYPLYDHHFLLPFQFHEIENTILWPYIINANSSLPTMIYERFSNESRSTWDYLQKKLENVPNDKREQEVKDRNDLKVLLDHLFDLHF